jgi:hypothetical protein
MIQLIITIILFIQVFFAGKYYGQEMDWKQRNSKEMYFCMAITIAIGVFGIVIAVLMLLIAITGFIYHQIWDKLHLSFIIKYRVLNRPWKQGFSKEGVNEIHKMAKEKANKLKWYKLGDRIFINNVKWFEKKHNLKFD